MTNKVQRTLEFHKITQRLADLAVSPMAKETALTLTPSSHLTEVKESQAETTEAVSMLLRKGSPSFGGFREIRSELKRAGAGGILSMSELMHIGEFLYVCRKIKSYGRQENRMENYERLEEYFDTITLCSEVEAEITRSILSETEMADDASPALASIRRDIKQTANKIRDQLHQIITSSSYKNMLQDMVITQRNDRYCVPIKSEYRSSFPGMVHDQSNTGSTVFMEPLSVVNLNNQMKEHQSREKAEIEAILLSLSALVSEHADDLEENRKALTHLDFLFAKAALSLSMHAVEPVLNTVGKIDIQKGRHPLISPDDVVPIDISLGDNFTTLLITGPNTGGKTVALKTLGLFTLMAQAGLHIPAAEHSAMAIFDHVFADIGDEQSIEQSLSTFSSHMRNIITILENVTPQSLVLFDELSAGTDPAEGAALAQSIIQRLHQQRVRTVVTTHYSELKVYALSAEGVQNASCEFDVETLRPTYRLLMGIPGKSNAFAISQKLGLSLSIIEDARSLMTKEEIHFEDLLTDLEIAKKNVIIEQERAERYRREAKALQEEAEKQSEDLRKRKEKILAKAREEASALYLEAKNEADRLIKALQQEAKNANRQKLNETRTAIREQLSSVQESFLSSPKRRPTHRPPDQLVLGDRVYIISFDQTGTALGEPDRDGNVLVQMGSMKAKFPLAELMLDQSAPPKPSKPRRVTSASTTQKSQHISSQIDCRGQNVEEGLDNVDKYLDDAYLSGLKQIMIIHGKGTGVLRSAVQTHLRTHPHVKSFRPGTYGEGEMGVTVVELN